jgi:hypothetical protein
VEDCVDRALGSVIAQTYRDFCIYAVDDGSTDGTARVLEKYAHRGVCAYQPHTGQAAARNRGILLSKSPYVAFLDADDEWLPTKLARQIAYLRQDPSIGFVCSGCAPSEGATLGSSPLIRPALSGRLFEQLARDCFVFTPTVVVRRRCLEEVGLFDESLAVSEDFSLWLRIAARWKIAFLPEVLAIRHNRPEGLSLSTDTGVRLLHGIASLEKVRSACPELSAREGGALDRALAQRNYFYGSYLLSSGEKAASRSRLLSACKLQPSHWRAFAKLGLSFLPAGFFKSFTGINEKLRIRLRSGDSGGS